MLLHDDVRTLTVELVRDRLGYLPSVVVGSPPCQDASSANLLGRGLDGAQTGLFAEFTRIVGEIRPRWCAAENSAGLTSRGLDRICMWLEADGYAVWPLEMGAVDFGAPHPRQRLWIIGVDADQEAEPGLAEHGEVAGMVGAHPWSEPWAESQARFLVVADGLSAGLAGKWASAIGDAVVPQITQAIGATMMRLVPTDGTVLDLFAGAAAGWSLGLHRAGYRTVAACEIDPWRRSVLQARWGEGELGEVR